MKKTLLKTAAIVLCTSMAATPSFANNMQGAYVNGNLGATQFPGLTYKDSHDNSLSLSSKLGLAGGLALGSQNDNMRIELAVNYWENRIKRATLQRSGITPNLYTNSGTGSILLGMINGYYDFSPQQALTPYLGLGIGVAQFREDMLFDSTYKVHSKDNDIAYQAIVGAAWDVAPCVKANLDYRYLITGPQKINVDEPLSPSNLRSNYQNHRVSAGLTYYLY